MTYVQMIWGKLLAAARQDPEAEVSVLVLALERSLEQFHEQPLEVAFRLLKLDGPALRVSIDDLGKLIHDYHNAQVMRQGLEQDVEELEGRLQLLVQSDRMKTVECPHCSATFALPARAMSRSSVPPA